MMITIYVTIIVYFYLYGCGTWSLTFMETDRLKVFENMALGKVLVLTRKRKQGSRKYNIMRRSIICPYQTLFARSNKE
jgi:hypothetical protein